MKKIVIALSICLITLFNISDAKANAGSGFYVSPRLGLLVQDQNATSVGVNSQIGHGTGLGFGVTGGLAIGYDKQYSTSYMPIRLEAEALFRSAPKAEMSFQSNSSTYKFTQNIGVQTYFINVYYDFHSAGSFVPFIGAGAGYTRVTNKFTQGNQFFDTNSNQLAYNAGVGLSWLVQTGFGIDIGYRYTHVGKTENSASYSGGRYVSNAEPNMHEVIMAVRLTF